jgi:methylmalonyl-CoA mutase cobalamin-binding subunit
LSTPLAIRSPRKAVIVVVGDIRIGDRHAYALAQSLRELGVETSYLGRVDDAARIAELVCGEGADAVELLLGAAGGVALLRTLLRQLTDRGRRDVSIVVHRLV